AGDDDTCLPLDARGYRRPHGDHCDIGAVEVGATAPPDTDGDVDEVIDTSFRLNDTGITRGG
ncbi:choice-of-anchor Q domain-containing protein, partial [Thiolapillus sp.]